jgi:nucleoside-diphosphate-sugar epimerase
LKVLIAGGCEFLGSRPALYLRERRHELVAVDNPERRGIETNIGRLQTNGVAFVHGDAWCVGDFAGLPSRIVFHCDANAQLSIVSGYTNPMFDLMDNTLGVFQGLFIMDEHHWKKSKRT